MGPFDGLTEAQRMQIRTARAAQKEQAMRAEQERPRGICSVCERGPFLLTKAGNVRHHADYRRDEYHCDGAGKPPKE